MDVMLSLAATARSEADDVPEESATTRPAMIEKLPSDVMVRVLEFVDLPDCIRLATCSKRLQNLVYQDCVLLWRDIDLSKVNGAPHCLTDDMLSSLLLRVNAKTVTRSMNLDWSTKITGTGLTPLSESQVLETLDFRENFQFRHIQIDIFVPILRTMIPHKLVRVRFRDRAMQTIPDARPS